MKIKKTWFSTEIELTPQEIEEIASRIYRQDGVYKWLIDFLKRF